MIESLLGALVPIIVTMLLGYVAAAKKFFNRESTAQFNKLVMDFALPLSLFFSINQMPRNLIISNWRLGAWLLLGMFGWYLLVYVVCRRVLKTTMVLAALRAFTIATPAGLFVGPALLSPLFPKLATIDIAISGLIMNLIQLTLTMFIITAEKIKIEGTGHVPIWHTILTGLKKPVVWSPVFGFITALIGFKLPTIFGATFQQLGVASAGVALFSIGITLHVYRPSFSKAVLIGTLMKEVVAPFSIMCIMFLVGAKAQMVNIVTLTLLLSPMVFPTILAEQSGQGEREMASTLFLSTVTSFVVITGFIVYRGLTL